MADPLDTPVEPVTEIPDPRCTDPACLLAATHDGECLTRKEPA